MKFPEPYRFQHPALPPHKRGDPFGYFVIPPAATGGRELKCVVAGGEETGWEHVSVSLLKTSRQNPLTPNWYEMDAVKDLFWDGSECVVQFHVPKEDHLCYHNGVLHLWRKTGEDFPMPPKIFV